MSTVKLTIPASADHIDLVRICLYGIAAKIGFSYEDIEDMKVAVSEACNNAVLYGNRDAGAGDIEVSFEPTNASLVIGIRNNGPQFEYGEALQAAEPLQGETAEELRVGGLGIYLMEALMDEVNVRSSEGETEVRLTKFLIAEGGQH
ncbi:ATP-binding protein [Paenibacillus sp. GSMTC-2017]|uniref:ATP-binding protein n=1 Tax=Paenibacillus sp. GSMTC-2017 TaxID=2794350 RepID=UPI0018D641CC|nr:ATP-binding protein [Paenibacillus sp. GSMTC-2017]MBH5319951.1 ATP-binding protein [Paenibacillus sp. GSMTC-2017]